MNGCRFLLTMPRVFRSQGTRGGNQLHTNAVLEFEERLEAIKVGLGQGVDCVVWEGDVPYPVVRYLATYFVVGMGALLAGAQDPTEL